MRFERRDPFFAKTNGSPVLACQDVDLLGVDSVPSFSDVPLLLVSLVRKKKLVDLASVEGKRERIKVVRGKRRGNLKTNEVSVFQIDLVF